MSLASPIVLDLDRQLIALSGAIVDAAQTAETLDDDMSFDVGLELHAARTAVQEARDLLDAVPFSRYDAEPRSAVTIAGLVASYA